MIKTFITPPNNYLELTEKGTGGFYCLGQIYKKNEKYREYALEAKRQGRFIILDSGVGDHGKPLSNRELFEIAKELRPNEIIPLDNLYNCEQTIKNCAEMAQWLKDFGLADEVKILMCPQGDTLQEWLKCYEFAMLNPAVSTTGLSKKTIPHILFDAKPDEMIAESRHMIYDILKYKGWLQKPIHLLGSAGTEEYEYYENDPIIRSTDSCVAVWMGMNLKSVIYSDRIPTPADYFERSITNSAMEIVRNNIYLFNRELA